MELNSILNSALEQAQKRRAAASGMTDKFLTVDGIKKSAEDQGYSEVSVEDLANAMKLRDKSKSVDNLFVERHLTADNDKKDDKEKVEATGSTAKASTIVEHAHSKIKEVSKHTEILNQRKDNVFQNLRQSQNNPFVTK
ncbi:MAG: hypothetical protein U0457_15680 [Candidatus Sericytochromatia bacterium]